jgi:RNA polymerase sigma-70 factor (ECF subfamily)
LSKPTDQHQLIDLITEYQGRLFGFLFSILGNPDQANEVLQETNLVLWKKSSKFQLGTNFKAWSFRIASLQAMAYRQKQIRDRLVFDDDLFHDMVQEATQSDRDDELDALQICLSNLPEKQSKMVHLRYLDRMSIRDVADAIGKKENAVMQTLFRVRKALSECIQQRVLKTS